MVLETRKEAASWKRSAPCRNGWSRSGPRSGTPLPDIGLYMDQLISYMPRQLIHYGEGEALTSAMVNNYIKDGALPRPTGSGTPVPIWLT